MGMTTGTVTDTSTGLPAAGETIEFWKNGTPATLQGTAVTNANGVYAINLIAGSYIAKNISLPVTLNPQNFTVPVGTKVQNLSGGPLKKAAAKKAAAKKAAPKKAAPKKAAPKKAAPKKAAPKKKAAAKKK